MVFRHYVDILRRRTWFIAEAVVLVALAAGVASTLQTPAYEATARILLRPDDPAEQLNPVRPAYRDASRYVQAQRDIITSEAVAQEAASSLPGLSAERIARAVTVRDGAQSDLLKISARDTDPVRARDIANSVAKGYIENRRKSAVVGLERAAGELQEKLGPLQATIAELDIKIASLGGGGTVEQDATVKPLAAPLPPREAPQLGLTAGGLPSTSEALKATRYAAAVQYETLYARQQELLVDISLKRGEAELIAEATTPTSPVSPRPARDLVAGAMVGLLLGVGVALLREHLDDRLRSAQEVEQATGLPTLAELPYDKESASDDTGVAAIARPLSSLSEAVRSLRTSIHYLGVDRRVKVIVVTSTVPGEGKSLVSANLAAVYAQAGHRTMLIGADLRREGIDRLFGLLPSAPGLTEVVAPVPSSSAFRRGTFNGRGDDALNLTSYSILDSVSRLVARPTLNLSVLPSGSSPPNPAELLGSQRMRQVLTEIADAYDIIVIDTPPLLPVTDAAVLAALADGVLLVTALGETRREALHRANAILAGTQARVLGAVVNKSSKSSSAYYYEPYAPQPDPGQRRNGRRRRRSSQQVGGEPVETEPAESLERDLEALGLHDEASVRRRSRR